MVAFEEMVNNPNGYYQGLLKGQAGKDVAYFLSLFESYRDELIDENERIFEDKITHQEKLKSLWEQVVESEKLCTAQYENTQNENYPLGSMQAHENKIKMKSSNDN